LSDTNSAAPTFTAPVTTTTQVLTFGLRVVDNGGAVSLMDDTVTITVNPASNIPPVANAGPDQSVEVGGAVEPTIILNGSGSDSDGSVVLFAWTQTGGATIIPLSDTAVANPTLVPPPDLPPLVTALVLIYELVVTDNQGAESVADSVTITVNPFINLPPVANAGVDQTVTPGDVVTLNGSGTDADGTIVAFVWADNGIPLSDPNSAAPTFTAPVTEFTQEFTFDLIVTDNSGAASAIDSVAITVNPAANQLPVALIAGGDQIVAPGETVFLDGNASFDLDGTIIGFEWTIDDPTIILTDSSIQNPSFTAPSIGGSLLVTLIVTDNLGEISVPVSINILVDDLGGGGGIPPGGP
ncbi:MAG: PKD domain-containing protein, partial [Thiotrichaceae bacterium]